MIFSFFRIIFLFCILIAIAPRELGDRRFADQQMIDGLKDFQRARGLVPDGVMKPDGPTARELGKALTKTKPQPRRRAFALKPARIDPPSYYPQNRLARRPFPLPGSHTRPWDKRPPASITLFNLTDDVGRDRTNDPRDVLAARRALEKMLREARLRKDVESREHISGGKTGEFGHLKEKLRKADSGVRGARADGQVKVILKDGTERIEELQTVDTYADGETLKPRDSGANERIKFHKNEANEIGEILSIPERPDLTDEEYQAIADQRIEAFAEKYWGPRRRDR